MAKYKVIADLADEYVKQNNLLSKSVQVQVWNNFLEAWMDKCMDKYTPSQVVAIEFDRLFIDDGSAALVEIEI